MALLQAGLAAGTSLIGGMFGNKANSKAARDQFRYQDALNQNAFMHQRELQDVQNGELQRVNATIGATNREILDHHSVNESTVRTETSDSREDRSTQTGSIDFNRLVADAEAAGFNPLTVLRAGGLAGYSTVNTVGTSIGRSAVEVHSREKVARDLMTYGLPGGIPQGPSAGYAPTVQRGNPVGDALAAGFNAWNSFDANAKTRSAVEMELARAQIANLGSDTARNNRMNLGFQVPSWTATGQRSSSGGIQGAVNSVMPKNNGLGAVATPTEGKVEVTNPWRRFPTDPDTRDGQAFEDRYAGLGDLMAGAHVLGADLRNALFPNMLEQQDKNREYLARTLSDAWDAIKRGASAVSPLKSAEAAR